MPAFAAYEMQHGRRSEASAPFTAGSYHGHVHGQAIFPGGAKSSRQVARG